jgi:NAD(P)-dependent dehydrogenase (short-subunit alcohol dehydrogenase family)
MTTLEGQVALVAGSSRGIGAAIATAAAFLASGDAAWITGVVLDVAGGAVLV